MAKDECPNACPGHESFLFRGEGFTRRHMFRLAGTTIAGSWFGRVLNPPELAAAVSPSLRGTAKNCVFVFLGGAPSHVDTFDLKEGSWTPADFAPTSYAGVRFPQGLLPKTAEQLGKIAIVRPALAWAAVHSLGTTWAQIARNPSGALGKLAPHIGAVVSLESERTRKPTDILPGFLSLNGGTAGAGYMPSRYAPFAVGTPSASGLASLAHPDAARFKDRWKLIHDLDEGRTEGTLGKPTTDYDDFYDQAKALMDSPDAAKIFQFTTEDRAKYGATGFGDSLLVARNVLAAKKGTRFLQVSHGGWDNHTNIYTAGQGIRRQAAQFDPAFAQFLTDLAAQPGEAAGKTLLDETLVVLQGEFGRTTGAVTGGGGRDHYTRQFVAFAGGGVRGGRAIGATDAAGRNVAEFGWSGNRDVRNEDVAATIYSALGIDYTTVRYDDPLQRGFEYVPYAGDGVYKPVDELW